MQIAVVGIDGAGKSTQVEYLKSALSAGGSVAVCKAQGVNRSLVESMTFPDYRLFKETLSVAMALDLANTVRSRPDADRIIWDRYSCCVRAYFAAEDISTACADAILNGIPEPDLIIWVDTDPAIAAGRVRARGKAKPLEHEAFLSKVRDAYARLLSSRSNVRIVNGDRDPEQVRTDMLEACASILMPSSIRGDGA